MKNAANYRVHFAVGALVAAAMVSAAFPDRAGAGPGQEAMAPYALDWAETGPSAIDVSFLLEAPAGQRGRIQVKNGHLAQPGGKRFRIWGLNVTGQAGLPAKEHAAQIAAQLARRGINCLRFHFLDRVAPAGLLDPNRDDTRALDRGQLDRLDFFISELKQRGIYSDLNLNVARSYKAGDGVRDYQLLGFAKAVTYFDERLIELQKEYARQLLTHVNAYTGKAYTEEPAVAMVELLNENSLVERWFAGELVGTQTNKPSGTWHDIAPSYAEALTGLYNAWLARTLGAETLSRLKQEAGIGRAEPLPRLRPGQFKTASRQRFQAEASFYMHVEERFLSEMAEFLRQDLGVKAPLAANSDHWHNRSGYAVLAGTSLLDVVDGHVYWQHPESRPNRGFNIRNTPMVDDPLHSSVVQLSRSAFAGKPFTVSEVNHPFPAEHACEGVPILAAYAAHQDWDGIFWYTLAHRDVLDLQPVIGGHFDFAYDPVKMSQLAAGALMFLRGDVRPARRTLPRSYTREQVIESIRLPESEWPYFTPGFPRALALMHKMRIDSLAGSATGSFPTPPANGPIRSDTGEITWSAGEKLSGLVTVNTARSQAIIGFCRQPQAATDNLSLETDTRFCALTLSSLDGRPIANSRRMLLTAAARAANSGMEWNTNRTSLLSWGAPPTVVEPVTGRLILKNLKSAHSVSFQALTGAGQLLGGPLKAAETRRTWTLPLGGSPATWGIVSVER